MYSNIKQISFLTIWQISSFFPRFTNYIHPFHKNYWLISLWFILSKKRIINAAHCYFKENFRGLQMCTMFLHTTITNTYFQIILIKIHPSNTFISFQCMNVGILYLCWIIYLNIFSIKKIESEKNYIREITCLNSESTLDIVVFCIQKRKNKKNCFVSLTFLNRYYEAN